MSSHRDVRALGLGLCFVAAVVVGAPGALAKKRMGVVQGRILLPRSDRGCRPAPKAYWRFSVPNVTPPSCRPDVGGYLVTLDDWDPKAAKRMWRRAAKGGSAARMRIYGVSFEPRLLLVPKVEQSYQVVITNQDRFVHEIFSLDKKGDEGQIVAPDGSVTETFDQLKPLDAGEAQFFRMRCKRFSHMKGAVVFVRSTAIALPSVSGRFRIRVSQGKHVLRVWHDGKVVARREVSVERRPAEVRIDLRRRRVGSSRARPTAAGGKGVGSRATAARSRPSRHSHHGRRGRRRRRRRRRR